MVKTALRKYSDRIEIVASTPAKREEKWHALLKDKNAELVQLVDQDSYEVLKSSPASQDPRVAWVVFPRRGEANTLPVIDPKKLPST